MQHCIIISRQTNLSQLIACSFIIRYHQHSSSTFHYQSMCDGKDTNTVAIADSTSWSAIIQLTVRLTYSLNIVVHLTVRLTYSLNSHSSHCEVNKLTEYSHSSHCEVNVLNSHSSNCEVNILTEYIVIHFTVRLTYSLNSHSSYSEVNTLTEYSHSSHCEVNVLNIVIYPTHEYIVMSI